MDGRIQTGNESPPTRTNILGSFLRTSRPRNSSQSHIQVNTDINLPQRDLSPTPPQPPSPNALSARRRTIVTGVASLAGQTSNNSASNSGLGITSMLRRRRSAGNVAQNAPATPPVITTSATAAAALGMSNFPGRTPPQASYATTPITQQNTNATPAASGGPSHASHRIRLVPHLDTRRSLRFDAISRDLKEGDPALRIGRFTDRSGLGLAAVNALGSNKLAFRSKVVSRAHAEIWVENGGKFFLKDTKSSSGTFLNHVRLSPANTESRPFQIKDGDILQLGVDYQGGAEDIYKSVKIRVELGREWQSAPNAFNTNALKNLKSLALPEPSGKKAATATVKLPVAGKSQIPDCCICLFGVTIRQALFIAPCSHTFHYKCIRPLLESHHPAFSCPLCRTFADLEEDVEVEIEYEEEADAEEAIIAAAIAEGKDPAEDPDVGNESPPQSDREREYEHVQEQDLLDDNSPASRSNSGLGVRGTGAEAGAETEVEGDGSGLRIMSRIRAARRGGGAGGSTSAGGGDRASPLLDLADEADEMLVDVGEVGMSIGVVDANGDPVDVDGTVGGKRKR
ncbi:putative E3 ubiquitin-protein ligase dma1 [Psilocybe cubensis]|uniref:SMAD/FHA domain-containing protein n=2 Tax=Psilocybe cubensis TaxID=181762 RepID=A0A8H7XKJ8_PSICU|nr:putative E3 ubiquitin-protein ligase dma1 [Psilocybe cubensis]KAH9476286.1 putative E3 ubiquitin-protein ligase dma1 [Psilocybe cubensis]